MLNPPAFLDVRARLADDGSAPRPAAPRVRGDDASASDRMFFVGARKPGKNAEREETAIAASLASVAEYAPEVLSPCATSPRRFSRRRTNRAARAITTTHLSMRICADSVSLDSDAERTNQHADAANRDAPSQATRVRTLTMAPTALADFALHCARRFHLVHDVGLPEELVTRANATRRLPPARSMLVARARSFTPCSNACRARPPLARATQRITCDGWSREWVCPRTSRITRSSCRARRGFCKACTLHVCARSVQKSSVKCAKFVVHAARPEGASHAEQGVSRRWREPATIVRHACAPSRNDGSRGAISPNGEVHVVDYKSARAARTRHLTHSNSTCTRSRRGRAFPAP